MTVSNRQADGSDVAPGGRYMIDGRRAAAKAGVSYRTWLRLCDAGLAPWGTKLSALRRWDASEIDDWIAAGCPRVRTAKGGAR